MPRIVLTLLFAVWGSHPCLAQTRVFVSGDIVAEVKRFSGNPTTATLDGTTSGGGVRGGLTVTEHWTVELGFNIGRSTDTSTPLPIGVLAPTVTVTTPVSAFQSRTANRIVATSVLVGYRPKPSGKVHPALLGGIAFLHVTRNFNTIGPLPADVVAPALVIRPYTLVDDVPALTVGFETAVDLTDHLAVVPEIRADAFSLSGGGPSAFTIRPGAALRWWF